MNVVQLISSEGFYGAESMLVTLAQAQMRAGLRTTLAVFDDTRTDGGNEVAEKAGERGIETRRISCAGRFDRRCVNSLRQLLEQQQADILHCHGYKADLYGFAATRLYRVPLVSTCHNWPDRRFIMRAYAVSDRFALRGFDQVTTPARQVAEILLRSGVTSRKITIIANGIDVASFQKAPATLRHELPGSPRHVVGCVARLIPSKGGAVLLQAAKAVLSVIPEVAFVFVGDGPCRHEWQMLAHQLGIGDQVTFAGSRADIAGVYSSLDVLVLPSLDEAMPMCLLEALAAGCPVIATDVGEVSTLIHSGTTGLLTEVGDATALSEAILHTLLNPRAARERASSGQDLVERTCSSAAMARNYSAVYERARCIRPQIMVAAAEGTDSA